MRVHSYNRVFAVLAPSLRDLLLNLPPEVLDMLVEIRLRIGNPLIIHTGVQHHFISKNGSICENPRDGHCVSNGELIHTFRSITDNSVYALEEELKKGYVTIAGGHRVGIVGQAVVESGSIKTMKNISGLNIRRTREMIGAADSIMPFLVNVKSKTLHNSLIISPPGCGKTTLIRDISRQLSNGFTKNGQKFSGVKVCIVDERSEIAGSYKGISQHDVGDQTDVLDACPKAEGMIMVIRSMSPDVIITDEIGRQEDVSAIQEGVNAGVAVITTVHGYSINDLIQRPHMKPLMSNVFSRYIYLSRKRGPGTIDKVLDDKFEQIAL